MNDKDVEFDKVVIDDCIFNTKSLFSDEQSRITKNIIKAAVNRTRSNKNGI